MRIPVLTIAMLSLGLLAGCHKAVPKATASDPYEAEQIHTLTHDEDLNRARPLNFSALRANLLLATPSRYVPAP